MYAAIKTREEELRKNLEQEYIPNPQGQREGEGVRKDCDEPLTSVHARINHLFFKMRSYLWHKLFDQPLKLKEVLLNQRQTNL